GGHRSGAADRLGDGTWNYELGQSDLVPCSLFLAQRTPSTAALRAVLVEEIEHSLLAAKIDRNGGLVAFPPTKLARRKWQMLRLVFGCRYAAFKIRFPAFLRRRRADRLMQVAHGAVARGQRQASEDGLDAADALFGAQGRKPGQTAFATISTARPRPTSPGTVSAEMSEAIAPRSRPGPLDNRNSKFETRLGAEP